MLPRAFSALASRVIVPSKTFSAVTLLGTSHLHQHCIPYNQIKDPHNDALLAASSNSNGIVELRSESNVLLGLAFVNDRLQQLELFHITRPMDPLPLIDKDFFKHKIEKSFARRRRIISERTTCYRGIHSVADLLPSLVVDHYSAAFSRIHCASTGSEILAPIVAEYLQDKGMEECLLEVGNSAAASSPQADLTPPQRVIFISPSSRAMRSLYQEDGIQYPWIKPELDPLADGSQLLPLGFRYIRGFMRRSARDKRVLCFDDALASMTLNACLTASHVTLVANTTTALDLAREAILLNHGSSILTDNKISIVHSLAEVPKKKYDVISVEAHLHNVNSVPWKTIVGSITPGGHLILQASCKEVLSIALTQLSASAQNMGVCLSNVLSCDTSVDFPVSIMAPLAAGDGPQTLVLSRWV